MRLFSLHALVLVASATALPVLAQDAASQAARQALEERVFLRTVEEQGGRSHASGDRPELGPPLVRSFATFADPTIRVGLTPTSFSSTGAVVAEYDTTAAHNHSRVEITASGPFELVDLASGGVLLAPTAGQALAFVRSATSGAIAVSLNGGPVATLAGSLRVRPAGEGSLLIANSLRRINRLAPLVNGTYQLTVAPYRGELEVLGSEADASKLRLVNLVGVEDYVPGVVVNESLGSFPLEALRAQAITARGYALANVGRFATRGFDIDDSTLSQMYRGQASETPVALEAAVSTTGLVLTHQGRLISALYSSSMGGHTESNEFVFPSGGYPGGNADPALRGIHDSAEPLSVDLMTDAGVLAFYSTVLPGAYEVNPATGSPLTSLHRWTRARAASELLARLRESFGVPAAAKTISDLQVILRGVSGRMMQVLVRGDWGTTTITGWSDLRRLASLSGTTPGGTSTASAPNSPSCFTITRDAAGRVASVLFVGGGFGHNVGMSQYGAQGRALRGQTAEEILRGYYTGVEIGTPPLLAGSIGASYGFVAPRAEGTLVVEAAPSAPVRFALNDRSFEVWTDRDGRAEVDLSRLLRPGENTLTSSSPAALLRIRLNR